MRSKLTGMKLEDLRRERPLENPRGGERTLPRHGGSVGTLHLTGDAETEDEGGLRAGVHAEGSREWCVLRQQRRAREATARVD